MAPKKRPGRPTENLVIEGDNLAEKQSREHGERRDPPAVLREEEEQAGPEQRSRQHVGVYAPFSGELGVQRAENLLVPQRGALAALFLQ